MSFSQDKFYSFTKSTDAKRLSTPIANWNEIILLQTFRNEFCLFKLSKNHSIMMQISRNFLVRFQLNISHLWLRLGLVYMSPSLREFLCTEHHLFQWWSRVYRCVYASSRFDEFTRIPFSPGSCPLGLAASRPNSQYHNAPVLNPTMHQSFIPHCTIL